MNKLQKFQEKIITEIGKEKVKIAKPHISERVLKLFEEKIQPIFMQKVFSGIAGKNDLSELVTKWNEEVEIFEDQKEKNLAKDYLQEKID